MAGVLPLRSKLVLTCLCFILTKLRKSELIFPSYKRGERGSGEVNPKSQRWDSHLGLGGLC